MPDIETKAQYEQYQANVAAFIAREQISFLSTSTDEEARAEDEGGNPDPWFSWSPCECCGCSLGGNREYLFARDANDEIVSFEICEDCVYYIEYGHLDDSTMQRVDAA